MKWTLPEPETNPCYLKSGPWTITKPGNLNGILKPYGLFYAGKLVQHFPTSKEAMQHAEMLTVTQI